MARVQVGRFYLPWCPMMEEGFWGEGEVASGGWRREAGGEGMEDKGCMKEGVGVEYNMKLQGWNVLNTTLLLGIVLLMNMV